jgi:hypothetical protein
MQLSRVVAALQAVAFLSLPLAAQARYRVTSDGEWFHQEPGGRRLARLARGAVVTVLGDQGDWLRVTIDGWIFGTSVGPSPRAGFDLAVTRAPDENLRSAPGGALVAKLAEGFLLVRLSEDKPWVRVKRDGFVQRSGLSPIAEVAARRSARDSGTGVLTPGPRPGDSTEAPAADSGSQSAQSQQPTTVYRAPEGPAAGTLAPETPLRVLSRTGEWARVQLEGWVKTSDSLDAAIHRHAASRRPPSRPAPWQHLFAGAGTAARARLRVRGRARGAARGDRDAGTAGADSRDRARARGAQPLPR